MNSPKEHNLFEIVILCSHEMFIYLYYEYNKIVHAFENILKLWTPEINNRLRNKWKYFSLNLEKATFFSVLGLKC